MKPEHERLNRYIDDLQAGRTPSTGMPHNEEERELFQAAASWNAARPGSDTPDPEFVARLRGELADNLAGPRQPSTPAKITAISEHKPAESRWQSGRRQFLITVSGIAAGIVAGLGLDRVIRPSVEVYAEPQGQIGETQGKWFAVVRADEVPVGEAFPFTAGYVRGIVLNRQDGFVALSGSCTHLGCTVNWKPEKQLLECGCHGSSFDSSGKPHTGPALYREPIRGLHAFDLKIVDGVVHVFA